MSFKVPRRKDSVSSGGNAADDSLKKQEEPDFSDPEDFVDNIDDEELLGDLLRKKPKEEDGVANVIVIDGLPVVAHDRVEKLKNVIRKMFGKFGNLCMDYLAVKDLDEAGDKAKTTYMFVEYEDPAAAQDAVATMNNYKLDKNHTLLVNSFSDFDKYENISDKWVEPKPQPFKDHGNLWEYLMEPHAFDQYLILKSAQGQKGYSPPHDIQIVLNSSPEPTVLLNRKGGTDTIALWSSLGTYLATFHEKGVVIWGGKDFVKINRFIHPHAELIDFSPNERYIATYAPSNAHRLSPDAEVLVIWDVRTGAKKRSFSEIPPGVWPVFKWSHDDKYFAKITPGVISVYETPSFKLNENKSLKIPGATDFTWSPTDNILAYWVKEEKEMPACVALLEMPGRNIVCSKNLFNVADCRMHWQISGDFLCVKVDRYSKMKSQVQSKYTGMYYTFEIFHMREKLIPVDSIELKEPVVAFAWEPVGTKFIIIHGKQSSVCTSFWDAKGDSPTLLKRFEGRVFTTIFWSPKGQFVVLASLNTPDGPLEFIDTSSGINVMHTFRQDLTTGVEWDPTGRYVVAFASAWSGKISDACFTVLNYQGSVLRKERVEGFGDFHWRPRPPSLLSSAQIKEIKKNLKKYSATFETEDRMRLSKASKETMKKLQDTWDAWREYRRRKEEGYSKQKPQRMLLRNNVDTDEQDTDESQMYEETVDVLIREDVIDMK